MRESESEIGSNNRDSKGEREAEGSEIVRERGRND